MKVKKLIFPKKLSVVENEILQAHVHHVALNKFCGTA